ncbi:MAG TPA: glutamate decarboxylase [Firmicutes bacterium]|nr:glutamate decarboxylase [Bacillota bacterium]
MWTVVYVARNRAMAEMLKKILENEGMLATLRSVGIPHMGDACNFEILVPSSEAEEAATTLAAYLSENAFHRSQSE